ncbi:MAG: peroxide stress protein YaaA [Bacteriovoracaceae bacterium]|jgi:uncharacterized protein|nr:peroxide stress protein YaaA [Bacteriovoracaceae bacterium]
MLIVISPAKKLDFKNKAPTIEFGHPPFLKHSQKLIDELRTYKPAQISKLMGLSQKLTDLNVERYKDYKTPFNLSNAKQAIYAFKGDTYVGLDVDSMKKNQINYAQKHLRILSGLYGIISPLDLIQPYRLEMGTQFPCQGKKNLQKYWNETITKEINQLLAKDKSKILINLASKEYFGVIDQNLLTGKVITPVFKEKKDGKYKIISFFAKKARGMMSRYIIDHKITDPKELLKFDTAGYIYNPELSTKNEPTFVR